MDTTFLNYVLAISLMSVLVFALYQANYQASANTDTTTASSTMKEKFNPIIWDTCKLPRAIGIRNEGLAPGAVYDGMPVHRIGPVINFHQSFKPFLPELGWRATFLDNYSDYQVAPDTNFDGTMVRNYLNNLESVDNIYRKC